MVPKKWKRHVGVRGHTTNNTMPTGGRRIENHELADEMDVDIGEKKRVKNNADKLGDLTAETVQQSRRSQ